MEEDLELPVITFLNQKEDSLDSSGEEGIIYLTTNEAITQDECKVPNYIIEQNVILDPLTLDNTKFQLVTLGDPQFIYITTDDNGEECIEPHLLTNEIVSLKAEDDIECQINEQTELISDQNEDGKPYEMIMVKNVKEKTVVEPQRKYKCLYNGCDKVYLTSQHLTVHMRNHTDSKPYMCKYQGCGKSFSTNYSLTAHWRTHTGEKPYMCKVCTRSFKTSGDLMKHMRTHTGEKPFLCPIEGCGKSFTTSNIRKVHVRSHTGERPYICDYPNCGKAFASSTNHKNHSRIHSGEKPYVCNVEGCDKKFTEYSSLYKHQTVHQTTKPFECNYCQQKFKSESTLNVHRKVKHGVLVSSDGIQLLDLESVGLVQPS